VVEEGLCLKNPFTPLGLPTPKQTKRDVFYSEAQREVMLSASRGLGRPEITYVLMLGFFAGLRVQEIVEARGAWFYMQGSRPYLHMQPHEDFAIKNKVMRMVPLHSRLVAFFEDEFPLPCDADQYVLMPEVRRGSSHLRWDPRKGLEATYARALTMPGGEGLPKFASHVMRHTFASLHVMNNTADYKIIRWLGITRDVFEKHYAGLRPDDDIDNC
jgi:integrase